MVHKQISVHKLKVASRTHQTVPKGKEILSNPRCQCMSSWASLTNIYLPVALKVAQTKLQVDLTFAKHVTQKEGYARITGSQQC